MDLKRSVGEKKEKLKKITFFYLPRAFQPWLHENPSCFSPLSLCFCLGLSKMVLNDSTSLPELTEGTLLFLCCFFLPPLFLQRFPPCLAISGCVFGLLCCCFFFESPILLHRQIGPLSRSSLSLSLFLSAIVLRLLLSLGPGSRCSVSVLGGGPGGTGFSSHLLC